MGGDLITVPEEYEVHEALTRMREEGVRRMPVVNQSGVLIGIVTFDDLLPLIAEELADLARLSSTGRKREYALRH
jgi:Mg/Co/Ni transporter MgtE